MAETLDVSGLAGQVVVLRDEWGIPHIRAGAECDAHFALGFVHAQDRLFQMELNRRRALGRAAEWLGAGGGGGATCCPAASGWRRPAAATTQPSGRQRRRCWRPMPRV